MEPQFIHLDYSAMVKVKGKRGDKWSNADLIAEATRQKGHIPHVIKPHPYILVYGCEPGDVLRASKEYAETSRQANGKRHRKDSPSLASGVISWPRSRISTWRQFRAACIQWLFKTYGRHLKCIVEHTDEEHPHIHFYLVPLLGEPFGVVHPGYEARRLARLEKSSMPHAFGLAMAKFQQTFFDEVGNYFGLARTSGAPRARLSRRQVGALRREQRLRESSDKGHRDGSRPSISALLSWWKQCGARWPMPARANNLSRSENTPACLLPRLEGSATDAGQTQLPAMTGHQKARLQPKVLLTPAAQAGNSLRQPEIRITPPMAPSQNSVVQRIRGMQKELAASLNSVGKGGGPSLPGMPGFRRRPEPVDAERPVHDNRVKLPGFVGLPGHPPEPLERPSRVGLAPHRPKTRP